MQLRKIKEEHRMWDKKQGHMTISQRPYWRKIYRERFLWIGRRTAFQAKEQHVLGQEQSSKQKMRSVLVAE